MDRESKIRLKKLRRQRRIDKRRAKDLTYLKKAFYCNSESISFGRRVINGSQMICEMRYSDCESRGYCNGDC